jgi:hypothetical protein
MLLEKQALCRNFALRTSFSNHGVGQAGTKSVPSSGNRHISICRSFGTALTLFAVPRGS